MKRLSLIIIMLGVILLVACATQTQEIPGDAVFQFEIYGGYVPLQMAKQLITITPEKITYVTSSQDDTITEMYQKEIIKEEYGLLVKLFNDKKFLDMKDKYSPPEITVADAGNAKITVNFANTTKSVILEPYFLEYYSDDLRFLTEKMQSYLNTIYDISENRLNVLAEKWITNAPTYSYDGSNLQFKDFAQLNTTPPVYLMKYSFKSGGYGNRSASTNSQSITKIAEHEIVLAISKEKIIGAVIDGKWDELKQDPYEVTLKYQPKICIKPPWKKWYEAGTIKFIKKPVEEELVIAYYSQLYAITVQNFKLVSGGPRLIICGDPESYYYTITVSNPDAEKMLKLGWTEI